MLCRADQTGETRMGVPTKRVIGIFVSSNKAQRTLELVKTLKLKFDGLRLVKAGGEVGIPLLRSPTPDDQHIFRTELGGFRIREATFATLTLKPKDIREALRELLPSPLAFQLRRAFDTVGDIVIIELPRSLEPYSQMVGRAISEVNPQVRLVLKKSSEVTGVYRTRELEKVWGSGGTETVHREFGCEYRVDVSSVYFNPRLAHERHRIAEQVKSGEVVVDMFAGVGPYSILIAKLQPECRIYAVDINPAAVAYLRKNILTNQVAVQVIPLCGDAEELSKGELRGVADQLIMNLPSDASRYVGAALRILKTDGGVVHYYEFEQRGESLASVKDHLSRAALAVGRRVQFFIHCGVVREVAPGKVQVALDAFIK